MVAHIFMIVGFLAAIAMYFKDTRDDILRLSIVSSLFYGLFFIFHVSLTGGFICLIAILNTIMQIKLFDNTHKSRIIRLGTSCFFAIMGTVFLAENNSDFLPMFAFIVNCYAEAFEKKNNIFFFYIISLMLWTGYSLYNEAYIYTFLNMILFAANLIVLNENMKSKFLSFMKLTPST
ncbi:MAG: YgjV family protein [Pseudomonadota bacterium]